ncbi:MAG: tyrosine-type recombinase/integrase [Thermodesulfobacteriota bacterium]
MAKTRQWFQTDYPGVRYREDETRTIGASNIPDRYYAIRYYVDGKRREEGLGWASEGWVLKIHKNTPAGRMGAFDVLSELRQNIKNGTGPRTMAEKRQLEAERRHAVEREETARAAKIEAESAMVFDAVFNRYLKENRQKRLRDEIALYKHHISKRIGKKQLNEITLLDLELIREDMEAKGRAKRSIQYAKAVIRQVFNHAIRHDGFQGSIPTRDFLKGKSHRFDNKRMRFLSYEEANQLLSEVKKISETTWRICLLSLNTGMRFSEIAKLQWQHVNQKSRLIFIVDPKGKEGRSVFMNDSITAMFSEMGAGETGALVFPDKRGGIMQQISETFNRCVDRLGLNKNVTDPRDKVVFHSLRHTAASWLLNSGADLPIIQKILGHKEISTTMRYAKVRDDRAMDALQRLGEKQIEPDQKNGNVIHFRMVKR